jgi:hypothetical protein
MGFSCLSKRCTISFLDRKGSTSRASFTNRSSALTAWKQRIKRCSVILISSQDKQIRITGSRWLLPLSKLAVMSLERQWVAKRSKVRFSRFHLSDWTNSWLWIRSHSHSQNDSRKNELLPSSKLHSNSRTSTYSTMGRSKGFAKIDLQPNLISLKYQGYILKIILSMRLSTKQTNLFFASTNRSWNLTTPNSSSFWSISDHQSRERAAY